MWQREFLKKKELGLCCLDVFEGTAKILLITFEQGPF